MDQLSSCSSDDTRAYSAALIACSPPSHRYCCNYKPPGLRMPRSLSQWMRASYSIHPPRLHLQGRTFDGHLGSWTGRVCASPSTFQLHLQLPTANIHIMDE